MKLIRIILPLLAAIGLASCAKEGRVIPADDMSEIYAEMLVMDQWVRLSDLNRIADTSLVYEPILRRYGYSPEDYQASVEAYLQDPGTFFDIMEGTKALLQAQTDRISAVVRMEEDREAYLRELEARRDFKRPPVFDTVRVYPLTYRVAMDSTGYYALERLEPDTVFEGPAFRLRDTVAVTAPADSVKPAVNIQPVLPERFRGKDVTFEQIVSEEEDAETP